MSFLDDSKFKDVGSGDINDSLKTLLYSVHDNKYIAEKEFKNIIGMNGKRYIQSGNYDPTTVNIIEGSINDISAGSMIRVLNRFMSSEFALIKQIKSLMIYLIHCGFVYKYLDKLSFLDHEEKPIISHDNIELKKLIQDYYNTWVNKLDALEAKLFEDYPELVSEYKRTRSYFLSTDSNNVISYLEGKFNEDDRWSIYYDYVLPMREISKNISSPPANALFDLFKITKDEYRGNLSKAFKTLSIILPSNEYNSLLSRHIEEFNRDDK